MARKPQVEFANFVCKFGRDKNLLDYFHEVVLPAFTDTTLRRKFATASYFFCDVELIKNDEHENPQYLIAGRLVKNTILEREQIYDEAAGLIRDPKALESAPTAIFVLVLNNHKLLYLHETAHAPDLSAFRATAYKFISDKHKHYIKQVHQVENTGPEGETLRKVAIKDIVKSHPYPTLEVVPLSSGSSLEGFVEQFGVLRTIEARLIQTNHEMELDGIFAGVRNTADDVGSKVTTIKHHNPDGLDKDAAIKQLTTVAAQGNTILKLSGKDSNGDSLSGDNDEFKVRIALDNISKSITDAASQLLESFFSLLDSGVIKIAKQDEQSSELLQKIEGQ